jgi:type II secretory pathway pseudopilin PulG
MTARAGMALVEVIVASVLSSIVLGSAALLLSGQSRLARSITDRSERNDATRSALLTMRAELRALKLPEDLRAVGRDSIAARIFRGVAIVCGFRSDWVYLRYHGLRHPDPAKDSLLQVGVENTAQLLSASPNNDACSHDRGETVFAVTLSTAAPIGSLWLLFESGSYHLSTNALRYRRGAESRQPITNEVINDRLSSFSIASDSASLGLLLRQRGNHAHVTDRILLPNSR